MIEIPFIVVQKSTQNVSIQSTVQMIIVNIFSQGHLPKIDPENMQPIGCSCKSKLFVLSEKILY